MSMEHIIVKIVKQSAWPLPEYKTADAAGMDLQANLEAGVRLKPLERILVPTGLFIELPTGYEAQIRPRSGLAIKQGLTLLNTPGTIDADYRGEIKIIMVNLSDKIQEILPGQRIAQMVVSTYSRVQWEPAVTLSESERGTGGFGHTGHN